MDVVVEAAFVDVVEALEVVEVDFVDVASVVEVVEALVEEATVVEAVPGRH